MKKNYLFVLLLFAFAPIMTQGQGCDALIKDARTLAKNLKFDEAVKKVEAAKGCASQEDIDELYSEIFVGLKKQTDTAKKNQRLAEKLEKQAKINEVDAQSQRDKVQEEKNKILLILSFVQENNLLQSNWRRSDIEVTISILSEFEEFVSIVDSIPEIVKDTFMKKVFLSSNLFKKASKLLDLGQRQNAIAIFDQLISLDSLNIRAREQKIIALLRLDSIIENNNLALMEINTIKNYIPINDIALINEGLTCCRLGKYALAKDVFSESAKRYFPFSDVSTDQVSTDILETFGIKQFIVKSSNFDDFLLLYASLIDYLTGEKTIENEQVEKTSKVDAILYAILQLHRQLHAQPQDYGAYLALADLWRQIGFSELSDHYINYFLEKHSLTKDVRYSKFDTTFINKLQKKGRLTEYVHNNSTVAFSESLKYYTEGDCEKSRLQINRALDFEPDNLQYIFFAGQISQRIGDSINLERAINYFDQCIDSNPYHAEIYSSRAWAKRRLFNFIKTEEKRKKVALSSIGDIEAAYRINPFELDMLLYKFYVYHDKNEDLLEIFKKIMPYASNDIKLWKRLLNNNGVSNEKVKDFFITRQ